MCECGERVSESCCFSVVFICRSGIVYIVVLSCSSTVMNDELSALDEFMVFQDVICGFCIVRAVEHTQHFI